MNHLYYGDNLRILRDHIASESVDLVYLDPPFNSNASYNVLFRSPEGVESGAQIEAFDDTWHWGDTAEAAFTDVLTSGDSDAAELLRAMRGFLGENDMMAYLAMMAVRLIELHRVLKPTGSLYLHCDPTASHYLKILLDGVFGPTTYQSEIVWRRTSSRSMAKKWPRLHDIILFYSRSGEPKVFNGQFVPQDEAWIRSEYRFEDEVGRFMLADLTGAGVRAGESGKAWKGIDPAMIGSGRHWRYIPAKLEELDKAGVIHWPKRGRFPKIKKYLDHNAGTLVGDIWSDISLIGRTANERLGYPTQKPVALLERIVAASSNPGDVVLDPFCGCGTTIHAAEKLGRAWIGIDITHLAIALIQRRLREAFGEELSRYELHGVPRDVAGAEALAAQDKHQFELWAISLIVDAQPWKGGKKGADRGIDGVLYVQGEKGAERCLISVKGGGHVGVSMVRDLVGVLEREKAPMGLFVTLAAPTKPMLTEAAAAGVWELHGKQIPRLQIVTIEQLLTSPAPPFKLPMVRGDAYRKAAREVRDTQASLDL